MQLINIKMHLVLYQKKIEITNEFDVFIILSISSQISPTLFNKGKRLRIFFILKLLTSEVVELITFRFSLYKAYHGAPMVAQMIKNLLQCRRPGSGRYPGEGNGSPLWYSCLESSMNRGAWWATVHEVTKSWTPLSN